MKKSNYLKQTFLWGKATAILMAVMLLTIGVKAQRVDIPCTGYTTDLVANGAAGANTSQTSTSTDLDGTGTGFVFIDGTYNCGLGTYVTGILPASGSIASTAGTGLNYQLQSYGSPNALRIPASGIGAGNATLTPVTPFQSSGLYLLCVSGGGAVTSGINVTVFFTDATSQVFSSLTTADWCNTTSGTNSGGVTYTKIITPQYNRVGRTTTCVAPSPCQYFAEFYLPISSANFSKTIASINVAKTATITAFSVFALGSQPLCATPADQPTALNLNSPSGTVANGTFTAAATPPSGYLSVIYPSGSAVTQPTGNYSVGNSIGLGKVVGVGTGTSFSATGLFPGISYDVYVYSYISGSCATNYLTSFTTGQNFGSITTSGVGATLLISPYGDGGFETGNTFALNGWTVVNGGAGANNWFVGSAATPATGSRSAFIDNGTGLTNAYTITGTTTVHFYKDITFPAGQSAINLSFRWKGQGEGTYDYVTVYIMPTTNTPVVNSPAGAQNSWLQIPTAYPGAVVYSVPQNLNLQGSYQTQNICLPASLAGTTRRVVFAWSNDNSAGTQPPGSIDDIALVSSTPTPPATQATALVLTPISTSQINGSFTAATSSPNGYLVVRYPNGASTTNPVDGTTYTLSTSIGLGTVVGVGAATTFNSTGLSGGTTYDYYVYDYFTLTCPAGPVYNNTINLGQNQGSQTTNACGSLSGILPIGPGLPNTPAGGYTSLTGALSYINSNGIGGHTILELQIGYDGTAPNETFPIAFPFNACVNASKTITVRPVGGGSPANGLVITGTNAGPTFDFSAASYITIDGTPGGTTGTPAITHTAAGSNHGTLLNIRNTSATGSAIKIGNGSNNITVKYSDLQGQNTNNANVPTTISGVIYFDNTGANGNDNNTIDHCNIHSISGAALPSLGVYSQGTNVTSGYSITSNDNNNITNNNIYDFGHSTSNSCGLELNFGNNAWVITGNSFFQTAARTVASTFYSRGIWLIPLRNAGNVGNGFNVSTNYIGGSQPLCAGTAYTISASAGYFEGIRLEVTDIIGSPAPTSLQGNTIRNFNITTTIAGDPFHGAVVFAGTGNVNIGNIIGNTFGSSTATGDIVINAGSGAHTIITGVLGGGNASSVYNISNNTLGGITLGATNAANFSGIFVNQLGTYTINNNLIGSETVANSINATNTGTTSQFVRGMNLATAAHTLTVTNNIISNLNNATASTTSGAQVAGILQAQTTALVPSISGNTIKNLFCASPVTASGITSAVLGIGKASTSGAASTVSGNTIHTLKLTGASTTAAAQITGLFMSGPTSGTNVVSKNNLHSFSISAANNAAAITGITVSAGIATYSNNMVRLGYDESGNSVTQGVLMRGFTKGIAAANNFYHNSVYIGGTGVVSSTTNTFAFQRSTAQGATPNDEIVNNIFVNNRSNAAGTAKHYVFSAAANAFLTLNYNDYFFNGTGGLFGLNLAADVPIYTSGWVSGDNNSYTGDPMYLSPTGTAVTGDLHINPSPQTVIEQGGTGSFTVTDDIDGHVRNSFTPVDIGADAGNFTPLNPCTGPPVSATAALSNPTAICGTGSKTIILTGYTQQPGLTFQWQESASGTSGTFVNVSTGSGANTNTYTTATLSSSMYYLCVIGCSNGGGTIESSSVQVVVNPFPTLVTAPTTGTNVCSGSRVDLSASGASSYSWSCNPGTTFTTLNGTYSYPAVTLFITPNNLQTVTSVPTSTLPTGFATPPATLNTPTWTYTVTGTSAAGCTAQATVVLNVVTTATIPLELNYSYSPSPVCAPGTPITFTLTNTGTIGAGTWTYNWYDQPGTTLLQSTSSSSSTDAYTPATPSVNGNYVFTAKVTNSLCPSSYSIASPTYFVGYTSLKVLTDANCGDNGTLKIYPEGQNNYTTWYFNNFTTGLQGAAFDAIYGNTNITSGQCRITNQANSLTGAFLVRNPGAVNSNNLQVDFKLSTNPRGADFGIIGADGICWSYANNVTQGTVTTGGLGEGGSGTGLKLAFDATANTANNIPGAYLMYNCLVAAQGPTDAGVLAFKQGSFWQGLTNAPVSITITQNGLVTVSVNNQVIFDHVALPQAYLTANKSNWMHAFSARTGGSNELHAIDDLNIRYNPSYEYSITSTNGTDGTWSTNNSYTGLAANIYPVWVRNPANPSCFANTGNAVIATSPSPSSAITVAAPGFGTTICAGNSTTLTTDVAVPGATFLWETAPTVGGTYSAAPGTNNTETYSTGALTANAAYRVTFTCPSASAVTSTPILVTVNIGSIANTNSPQMINCIGDSKTLTATPGANTTCVWYDVPNGGSPLTTGNSLVVTPTSLPVTYYVEPVTTTFTDHYNNGGETAYGNILGSTPQPTVTLNGIASRFNTTASIRLDSIKVYPTASGSITVALQNALSSTNISSYSTTITAAQVGNFVNLPINLVVPGSGSYQLTTGGVALCNYYSTYTGSYASSYMSLGGVFSIVGASTTATGATSTSMYGTALNWSITTSCPAGFGNRTPVVVNANPAFLVSVNPATTTALCIGVIQSLTASSPNAYSSYTWSPVANLYSDAAATVPLTVSDNQAVVYFKSAAAGSNNYTVSTLGSGCTNTATAAVSTIAAPVVTVTTTPASATVCSGGNIQLNAVVSTAAPYCSATGGNGSYYMNNFSTTGGVTNITNNSSGFSPSGYGNFTAMNVTRAVGSSINWSASNFVGGTFGVAVFVDWNQNGLFTDAGDQLYSSGSYVTSASGSITVPAGSFNGNSRMRVVVDYLSTAPGACDVSIYHETEDYTFIVTGGVPNNSGSFTYDWTLNPTFLTATNINNPVAQNVTSNQTYSVTVSAPSGCSTTVTKAITVNPLPVTLVTTPFEVCELAELTLFASNDAPPVPFQDPNLDTYSWTTNAANLFTSSVQGPNVTASATAAQDAGTYTVLLTNQFGCTATDNIVVSVITAPVMTATVTGVGCTGQCNGSVQVSATGGAGGYTYSDVSFTNSNTDGDFSLNQANGPIAICAGAYSIVVSDALTCSRTQSFNVGTISTAAPTASVLLPPIVNLPQFACNGTAVSNINVPTVANATYYIWDAPTNTVFANGQSIDTNSTPTANITFGALFAANSGYYIGVQAANGCGPSIRKVQWVRGTLSVPSFTGPSIICTGTGPQTYTMTNAPIAGAQNYTWTGPTGSTINGSPSPLLNTSATSISLDVSGVSGGFTSGNICVQANAACITTAPKCIAITRVPNNLGVVSGAASVCPGIPGAINYTVPNPGVTGGTYNWVLPANTSGSSTSNSINITFNPGFIGGTLSVSYTNVCGQTSAVRTKSITIGSPTVPASITTGTGATTGLCGIPVTFTANPPQTGATFNWTFPTGSTPATATGTTAGSTMPSSYTQGQVCVTASNACGTSSPARCITVKGIPATPGATTPPAPWCAPAGGIQFTGNTGNLGGTYNLNWVVIPASSVSSPIGANTNVYQVDWDSAGAASVNLTASNACGSTTRTLAVNVPGCVRMGDVASTPLINTPVVNVYPNPASDLINIVYETTQEEAVSFELKDLSGRVILSQAMSATTGVNQAKLDVSKLAKGVYMLEVNTLSAAQQVRVVLQ